MEEVFGILWNLVYGGIYYIMFNIVNVKNIYNFIHNNIYGKGVV